MFRTLVIFTCVLILIMAGGAADAGWYAYAALCTLCAAAMAYVVLGSEDRDA